MARRRSFTRVVGGVAAAAAATAGLGVIAAPAGAVQTAQSSVVSADPADWTPNVMDGQVNAIVQVGNRVIVGGVFTKVRAAGSSTDIARRNLFSFDATTGVIDSAFNPGPDGDVEALEPASDGTSVYVGGRFNTIAGQSHKGVAKLTVPNGALVTAFTATTNALVNDVDLRGGRLYVGGSFTKVGNSNRAVLAAVDPTTGALDDGVNIAFTGTHNGGTTLIKKMDLTPDGTRLVAIGNFKSVGGLSRDQFVVVDTGGPGTTATVSSYMTTRYAAACSSSFNTYMRDVDVAPDGSYFAVVSTGAYRAGTLCDTTARWDWNAPGTAKQPTWVDYTGGDTLYSVAVTGAAIYVAGHNRWMNNPFRGDAPGPGAVPREGIAALDPSNGLPLRWNPGRTRGVGAFDLTATSTGLWVGSDTDQLGGEFHARLGFFPLDGGTAVPPVRPITLPANLYRAVPAPAPPAGTVLARVNAGGDQLAALDGGPVWAADSAASPSPLHDPGSNTATWGPVSGVTSAVPPTTPSQVFDSERWDPNDATEMAWRFPVASGTQVVVRLYFANRYSGTSQVGQRVFDVAIDGVTVLDRYDIVADVGDQIGTMKSFPVTSDGTIDISFTHEVENPLVNAIEIVTPAPPAPPASDTGNLVRRSFDGTTAGAPATVSGPSVDGIDWSRARGAFMLDGTVYAGWDDGSVYARTYDGTTFGAPRAVDLYGLTSAQFPVASLTGMTVTGGQMLYTVTGDPRLYNRYFTYESEVVGAERFTVSGNGDGFDWSTANGLAIVGGTTLYYGSSADGNLRRVTLNGLVPQPGTVQVVSGPGLDGIDWRTRALFFGQAAAVVNAPPTASFTSACTALACTFDGSGSTDPDGTVATWSWSFGDGATATGPTASHTYSAPGTYTVTLQVTDDVGAPGSTSQSVAVTDPPASAIAFRGASSTWFNSNWGTVAVPANVQAGDALVLIATANSGTANPVAPAGWTTVGTQLDDTMVSRAFQRVATAGDAGSSVRVDLTGTWKTSVALLAYSGTSTSAPLVAAASAAETANTASHATPVVSNTVDGAWVVSYWADRTSATTDWTPPAGATQRVESIGVGGGRISALAADSGGPVGAGGQGGLVATADSANAKATMWTLVLRPSP